MPSFSFWKKVVEVIALLLTLTYLLLASIYPRSGKIIAVEYDYDDYIVEDVAGLIWIVKGVEDLSVGDNVAMLMWNHFTPRKISDDIILKMR